MAETPKKPRTRQSRPSSGVTITAREIYDSLQESRSEVQAIGSKLDQVLEAAPEVTNRLNNHADRIRDLEKINAANSGIPAVVTSLTATVAKVETQVNRSAWVPVLVTAVVTAIFVGIAMAVVTSILSKGLLP